uniref:PGG domain-containing protein n=4 Tax=Triticinae TaxID=1648030 RepID=A0A453D416_AEGTS
EDMSANCDREREEARELAKYEEDCKEYKVTLYLLAMAVSVALAGLIAGFLVPRTPQWYSLYCWQTALVFFFSSAIMFGFHTRKFGLSGFPQRPDRQAQLGGGGDGRC